MTKTVNVPSTLSPARLSVGADITAEDLLELHHAQTFSSAHYGETHLSLTTAGPGWDDHAAYGAVPAGGGYATGALGLLATGSAEVELDEMLWIDREHAAGELECAIEAQCAAGNVVRCVFSVTGGLGVATATVDADDTRNGDEVMQTMALAGATAGHEWVRLRMSVQRLAGASLLNEVRSVRVDERELATLPDPSDD